jgi:hypothetical protein
MHSETHSKSLSAIAGFLAATAVLSVAAGPPDLEINPLSGFAESVDLAAEHGFRVRHVVDTGQGGAKTVTLVSAATGKDPRLAIKPQNGNTAVVWWQGTTGEVLWRSRALATTTWGSETLISSLGEDSRHPQIAYSGGVAWVTWEIGSSSGRSIAAIGIIDDPEPIPTRTLVASTTATGNLDLQVHAEAGALWLTWIESTSLVGWSAYDDAASAWGVPQYESYASGTVASARASIRAHVLEL